MVFIDRDHEGVRLLRQVLDVCACSEIVSLMLILGLANRSDRTQVPPAMQMFTNRNPMGYVELQVGSLKVKVPIRAAEQDAQQDGSTEPLATFETEGNAFAILVRGDVSSKPVERAMKDAAHEAIRHLSRKLLN
jgi:predicted nicotinamide N-methyase